MLKQAIIQQVGNVVIEDRAVVTSVAFSSDGLLLASGGANGDILIWDVRTQKQVAVRQEHTKAVRLAFSSDGKWLASGSKDRTVLLWEVNLEPEVIVEPSKVIEPGDKLFHTWGGLKRNVP